MPSCGAGERAGRGWDAGRVPLPPLPAAPRRQNPHHEERDEDDQEKPGTVTVIERDLRLLGRAIRVDVGRHLGPDVRLLLTQGALRRRSRKGSITGLGRRGIGARSAGAWRVVGGLSGQGTNGPMDRRVLSPESLKGPFRRTTVVRL